MAFKPGTTRIQLHELPRQRTTAESVAAIKACMDKRESKRNWQPPKDPDAFYRRNGLPSDAQASSETFFKHFDPHGND